MTTKNLSRFKQLIYTLCENLDLFQERFDLDLTDRGKLLIGTCPVHGGDNPSALNLYKYGNVCPGYWRCNTRHCEQKFKSNLIGLARGIISYREGRDVGFNYTIGLLEELVKGRPLCNIPPSNTVSKKEVCFNVSLQELNKRLDIPCPYFLARGFSADILRKFSIGLCLNPQKKFYKRSVVPIFNKKGVAIGFTARTINSMCNNCGCYHYGPCGFKLNKWINSKGLNKSSLLYNYWEAIKYTSHNKSIVLVESPGNVWRLEEAGVRNSVAMFGCYLSDSQEILLESAGISTVFILTDNDEAGEHARMDISRKLQSKFRIKHLRCPYNDVGESHVEQLKRSLYQQNFYFFWS